MNPESGQFVNGLLFFPKNTNEDNIIIKIDEIADPGKPLGGGANWGRGGCFMKQKTILCRTKERPPWRLYSLTEPVCAVKKGRKNTHTLTYRSNNLQSFYDAST